MADPVRNRLRLWLRTERALGLTSVAAPSSPLALGAISQEVADVGEVDAGEVERVDPGVRCEPVPARHAAQAIASPQAPPPVASRASSLFGDEQPTGLVMPTPEPAGFDAPSLTPEEKRQRLIAMDANEVTDCT